MDKEIKISNYTIGEDYPVFIIAEIGGNHNGSLDLALEMITAAKYAGADAVKFQTYKTTELLSPTSSFFKEFQKEELDAKSFKKIADYCQNNKIIFLSTPFDEASVDLLHDLGVPAFKIASGDITHIPLIRYVAKKKKPILLSTGASTIKEISIALDTIKEVSGVDVVLMHCVAKYPAPPQESNLKAIAELKNRFGLVVGFSDHSTGIELSLASIILGAKVIERHFTKDKDLPGGDNKISLLPEEFSQLVNGIRNIEKALKNRNFEERSDSNIKNNIRRSIFIRRAIKKGESLKMEDIVIIRPAIGIAPSDINNIIGKRLKKNVPAGHVLQWEDIEP
jgi:N-acetylneuraminate synthase/N,N'-diacetyllegionaminate synthase